MSLYRIKPLKWEKGRDGRLTAATPFGSYNAEKDTDGWRVKYCFDEYYDEGEIPCGSRANAVEKANEHWRNRIMPALDEDDTIREGTDR